MSFPEMPPHAKENDVLNQFSALFPELTAFAETHYLIPTPRLTLLAHSRLPLPGSTGKRNVDFGFVNSDLKYSPKPEEEFKYRWSHILVPGELKSNPAADKTSMSWIDLAIYARKVRVRLSS